MEKGVVRRIGASREIGVTGEEEGEVRCLRDMCASVLLVKGEHFFSILGFHDVNYLAFSHSFAFYTRPATGRFNRNSINIRFATSISPSTS